MGQNILRIAHGDNMVRIDTDGGKLDLSVYTDPSGLHGHSTISLNLDDNDAVAIIDALQGWLKTRDLKFTIGDIVYEPKHYKRAGRVISILDDRLTYSAPYRIQFIDQAEGQPETDYFAAEDLVLVSRGGL